MKDRHASHLGGNGDGREDNNALTRREWIGGSVLGAAALSAAGAPLLSAANAEGRAQRARRNGRRIIDGHVHLWDMPRDQPPMSDFATYPPVDGSAAWMAVDRLIPDYDARVGGPKVDKVVLIESSVNVTPDRIVSSNQWMLQTAALEGKILSVCGKLDPALAPATFAGQLAQLTPSKKFVGIRIGGGIFQPNVPRSLSTILPNVITNLTLMAKQGLQVDTNGISGTLMAQIGQAVPGLVIVMDHFAGKLTNFDVEDSWKSDMLAASAYPTLNIKVSDVHKLSSQAVTGAPAGLSQFQPIANPALYAPTFEFLWRNFGEDRLIFGTNWPVADAGGIFVDSIDLQIGIMESLLADKYSEARDKVMYQNALRVYGPRK